MTISLGEIDFNKSDGLVPAIIQDDQTSKVLMLGYMNETAFLKTQESGKVCFFSRTKNRLWTKGEESGNFLYVKSIAADCDNDTLLIKVNPVGPVCHTGNDTCWNEKNTGKSFIYQLENIIELRKLESPDKSYTAQLFQKGINKIAQKVGEEAIELVIEAKDNNESLFLNEASDLMYHYLVLLQFKGYKLQDIEDVLRLRHK